MPPPIGSMRITSAPNCAIVMPPSGAATKALSSTMRRSASSRFIAAPPFACPAPIQPKPERRGNPRRRSAEHDRVHDAARQEGEDAGDHQRAEKQAEHRPAVAFDGVTTGDA